MNISAARLRYLSRVLRWLPPETRGKARLARGLLGQSLDVRDVLLQLKDGNRFVVPSLREPVGFYLAVDGVYERQVLNFVVQHLSPYDVFVDVGANIGCFTVPIAQRHKNITRVLALEASPFVFSYLERNISLNHLPNVQAVHCAVTHQDHTEIPFYQAPTEHFGMGSLAPQFNAKPVLVSTRTLDSLLAEYSIGSVSVVKVDVEGFELSVFQGAEGLLRSAHPPVVIFEFCDWAEERAPGYCVGDAQRLLQSWGYRLWRLADYAAKRPPSDEVITEGFETLIAQHTKIGS